MDAITGAITGAITEAINSTIVGLKHKEER